MQFEHKARLKRFGFFFYLSRQLPLVFLVFTSCSIFASNPERLVHSNTAAMPRTVTVTGVGQATALADTATLRLSVEDTRLTSLEAKSSVDTKVNQFLMSLEKLGITSDVINAGLLRTSPQYEYLPNSKRQIIGYQASRNISIKLFPLDTLNEVMDLALSMQINRIHGVELSLSNADEYKQSALREATQNATEQAKWLASAFKAELGPVRKIDTLSHGHNVKRMSNNIEAVQLRSSPGEMGQGQYLFEKLTFDAKLQVVFDLVPLSD